MVILLAFSAIMIFPFVTAHSETIKNEEECKIADLCVHDKVPMCGIDSCGEMRTFIDTCDMHEFNCDSKKELTLQRPSSASKVCNENECLMKDSSFLTNYRIYNYFKQRPIHECWVTCKRGRSFKKPEFRTDCNLNIKNRV